MKRIAIWTIALALSGVGARAQQNDFGFNFEFGYCSMERFDSFDGTFARDITGVTALPILGAPDRILTVPARLTASQMAQTERELEQVGFFQMPARFYGYPSDTTLMTTRHPSKTYRLEVRRGEMSHTVEWDDHNSPRSPEAERFKKVLEMIIAAIYSQPAVRSMPPIRGGCE